MGREREERGHRWRGERGEREAGCDTLVCYVMYISCVRRLYVFRKLKNVRILIGGGDGTFGWVLSALQDCQDNLVCPNPPCALLPLGTGEQGGSVCVRSTYA